MLGGAGGEQLGHRGLLDEGRPGVPQPRRVVGQEARGLDLGRELREEELHGLELGDGLAELMPLLRIAQPVVERPLGDAHHLGADPDASFVEGLDGDLVALADLAQDVLARDADALQDQLASGGRADAELVLLLAHREPGEVALHQEGGDPLVVLRGVHGGEDDEELGLGGVGDPELAPGQLPVVPAVRRAAGQRERVRAGARLGERVGADPFRSQTGEVARLLLRVAPAQEGVVHERVLHVDEHGDGRIHPRQRLHGEDGHEEGGARAAVGLGDLDAHHAELEQGVDERARNARVLVHLMDERAHPLLREVAHGVAEHPLLLTEIGQREAAAGSQRLGHRCTSVSPS